MFTVCPKCTLTLVVTTVDLRAGQGYVRCGRCANVFNALIALREGEPNSGISDTGKQRLMESQPKQPIEPALGAGVDIDSPPEPATESEPESAPPTEAIEEFSADAEHTEEVGNLVSEEGSLEFDPVATDVSEIFIAPSEGEHDAGSGNYESIVLGEDAEPASPVEDDLSHTDTIAADDWSLLDDDEPPADAESVIEESPVFEAETDAAAETPVDENADTVIEEANTPDPGWVQEMFAEAEADAVRSRTAEREALSADVAEDGEPVAVHAARDASGSAAPSDTVLEPLLRTKVLQRAGWPSIAGICGLALLLALQIVHHYRQSLILSPTMGPAIAKVYGWFGATPTPRWDLSAYSVKQLGAEAEGADGTRLRVRLSVQNDSARVQPLPLLRLTLQDRYGNAVATRDLEPREYLPKSAADLRLLEPDKRVDAELHVVDPSKTAFGFEIDACLRAESGSVGCSNDARRRAAS